MNTRKRRLFRYCGLCGRAKDADYERYCPTRCRSGVFRFCAYGGAPFPRDRPFTHLAHLCGRHLNIGVTDLRCGVTP